jgi:hypothetical protein
MMPANVVSSGDSTRRDARISFIGYVLLGVVCFSVLTTWIPAVWPSATSEASIFLLAAGWLVRQFFQPKPVQTSWLLFPIGLAAFWGVLQLAIGRTAYPFATSRKCLEWLACLVVFFLALQVFKTIGSRRRFRHIAVCFGFGLSMYSMLQYFHSEGNIFWLFSSGYGRVLGPFVNRNHYSVLMELLLPLAIHKLHRSEDATRYWIVAGTMYASGIVGASRAGAILTTSLVIALTLLIVGRYPSRKRLANAVVLISCLIILTSLIGWQEVWNRFHAPDPARTRYEFNLASLKMLSERPWLGSGLGTWSYVYPAYAPMSSHTFANAAHNDWAQWAAEGGIGLPLVMLTLFVWSAVQALKRPWAMGIPTMLIHSAVDFPMQVPALNLCFFVMLGAIATAVADRPGDSRTLTSALSKTDPPILSKGIARNSVESSGSCATHSTTPFSV